MIYWIKWQTRAGDEKTLQYLAELSKPYGTEIRIKNGVGYIDLSC